VANIVIPTLMAYIQVLTPVLGMPLDLLKDVIFRLCGINSPGFFLLLANFGLLLSLAALEPRQYHRSLPLSHCSGASCLGSGTHLLLHRCVFHVRCLRRHLF
jgi:hypothetical protein